tara:strand:- start:198 stop:839 length:642 start_codon:yes stop_codon:yes gene_type:complete
MSIIQTKAILYNSKQIIKHFLDWKELWMKEKKLECSICMKTKSRDKFQRTKCNHIFCKDCLSQWFENNSTCPNCRENLIGNEEYINNNITIAAIENDLRNILDMISVQRDTLNTAIHSLNIASPPDLPFSPSLPRNISHWGEGWNNRLERNRENIDLQLSPSSQSEPSPWVQGRENQIIGNPPWDTSWFTLAENTLENLDYNTEDEDSISDVD